MFKRLFILLFAFIVIVVLVAVAALAYIKPDQQLDLVYDEISISEKAKQMITSLKPELRLTEKEINDLLKKKIVENTHLPKDVEITGADFQLEANKLLGDVNLRWKDKVDFSARLTFDLSWQEGSIVVKHDQTHIRKLEIPSDRFHLKSYKIPVESMLPDLVKVEAVEFNPNEIVMTFNLNT